MGVKYVRVGKQVGGQPYYQMAKEMNSILLQEMHEAAKEGGRHAREFIGRAGTARAWHESGFSDPKQDTVGRRYSSRRTRSNTGAMRDDIDYTTSLGSTVQVRVGWVRNYEKYYGIQDDGFSAGGFRPDQVVEGMGMMDDLRAFMRDRTDEALDRAMRRINNGL